MPIAYDAASLAEGVLARNRRLLAKAITLVESTHSDHRAAANALLDLLLPHSGKALRIGITGVPGVGKSTFIEAFGLYLIAQGYRVAVLAVDPSSSRTHGSILGDKTRMEQLVRCDAAFIRPSPSSGTLGGVAEKTREVMLLCEAAGFDVILVETVGVGQSETLVAGMTDCFVLMLLPYAGDDLQTIKKGIMELADIVVYNKADIAPQVAQTACAHMRQTLKMLRPVDALWHPQVLSMSALHPTSAQSALDRFWNTLKEYQAVMLANGVWQARRQHQAADWMRQLIDSGLHRAFHRHPTVANQLPGLLCAVKAGSTTPVAAAQQLLDTFFYS